MAESEIITSSDAVVVGADWISEHYFTTNATKESFKARVLARRKEWDQLDSSPRSRLTSSRVALLNDYSTLDRDDAGFGDRVGALNAALVTLLGFERLGLDHKVDGPVTFVRSSGLTDRSPLAIVDARPGSSIESLLAKAEENLAVPFEVDETTQVASVARLLSTLFTNDDYKPDFVLVLAGPHVLVAERERWPEGRYLAIDLQLVCERADTKQAGEIDRALACLDEASLAPNAEGDIWWTETLAQSVKHTVGVSKDLREGVRLSIEIIANEVVRRRAAEGLPALPAAEAQPLAKQSLRFLYRILFLLYAEASPELGVLPVGAPEYDRGYSLDRMRDLVMVDLPTPRSQAGTHLYDSLAVLFRLVDEGHGVGTGQNADGLRESLIFRSLRADLFKPEAIELVNDVKLGNAALQEVLKHLLLSKEARGKDRGFISYAELGINQLGAVYEGLMSYTGFFAESDLYEVAKDGNAAKGSWVVPVDRALDIADKDYVTTTDPVTGEVRPVIHERGAFVFRLAGRERQQSASYYTPEVLTRFVVSQALEELLDQDDTTTTAAEILELTICEPALGSGAFAIEAVRQLADQYLKRRQDELGEKIDPDKYPRELQKVKAYLALHQTYGVDLNATAVELAEISLWLDTMVEGLEAPWFGLHLRRGNSLIGARKAVFTRKQVEDKSWLKAVPKPVVPGSDNPDESPAISGRIPHFLLPADGWGAAADVGKDIKDLVPDAVKSLKDWRRSMMIKPTKKQVDQLVGMGERVERLWEFASKRLEIANQQIRREIDIWDGTPPPQDSAIAISEQAPDVEPVETPAPTDRIVTREEIEASLADPDGAYQRLRLVMDAWCALWFWPLTETEVKPPTLEEWYDTLAHILGRSGSAKSAKDGDSTLAGSVTWDDLGAAEELDLGFAGALQVSRVMQNHPWMNVGLSLASEHGFFHWNLDFAPVFDAGGFDLQVGNPPWVRPRSDLKALLAEGDPWWQLVDRPTRAEVVKRRSATLEQPGIFNLVLDGESGAAATSCYLGSSSTFPLLSGLQPDLYRCFMTATWERASLDGVVCMIHPETHFTDDKAGALRRASYARLRRHWQFVNALLLFEIKDNKRFGVHVYGRSRMPIDFLNCSWLYHPDTAERSLVHDGSGVEPGLRDENDTWDLRPHKSRLLRVDESTLERWMLAWGDDGPSASARMVYSLNRSSAALLAGLGARARLGDLSPSFSAGWIEGGSAMKANIDVGWSYPQAVDDVVLQGPYLFVNTPGYQQPNRSMKNNQDWSGIDLEKIDAGFIPATMFEVASTRSVLLGSYDRWRIANDEEVSATEFYRVAWRRMADNIGQRTLVSAIVPPGLTHVDGIMTLGLPCRDVSTLALVAAQLSSLLTDALIRSAPKADIRSGAISRMPWIGDGSYSKQIILRVLRLNCLTSSYSDLWSECYSEQFLDDSWVSVGPGSETDLGAVSRDWSRDVGLRSDVERRQAQVEIDALVALSLGVEAETLVAVYRGEFPVLRKFDRRNYLYDRNGRVVPTSVLSTWRKRGYSITEEERQAVHPGSGITYTYELPFITLDREADMRQAYAHFERVLAERQTHG